MKTIIRAAVLAVIGFGLAGAEAGLLKQDLKPRARAVMAARGPQRLASRN